MGEEGGIWSEGKLPPRENLGESAHRQEAPTPRMGEIYTSQEELFVSFIRLSLGFRSTLFKGYTPLLLTIFLKQCLQI